MCISEYLFTTSNIRNMSMSTFILISYLVFSAVGKYKKLYTFIHCGSTLYEKRKV